MSLLEEKISNEIKWRTDEIATLKFLPFHSNLSDEQKRILKKHTIPALYSLWEGFVKDAFTHYIDEINSLNIILEDIAPELLAHSFDMHYMKNKNYLNEVPKDFEKSVKRINLFFNDFKDSINKNIAVIPSTLPTESNINHEVITKILIRFNLENLPKDPFERNLNKLLNFRNSIAHGDFSIPVKTETIEEFSQLVIQLMDEILLRIIDGYKNKTYLSN
jgi:hypothetical protein